MQVIYIDIISFKALQTIFDCIDNVVTRGSQGVRIRVCLPAAFGADDDFLTISL